MAKLDTLFIKDDVWNKWLDIIYPVGSIYMSATNNSPSNLFGGTWAEVSAGYYIIGAGTTYGLGSSGGANTITLTVNQIPKHSHTENSSLLAWIWPNGDRDLGGGSMVGANSARPACSTANTGGGQAHSNMPAYYAVRIWRRTA